MRFYNIFFSPTGGTEKVADIVAKGTKLDAEEIDLIKEPDKLMKVKFEKKDLCLVAVPSYGGRIQSVVTDMFRKVKADGTKAILVALFGNRMIDDTLLEDVYKRQHLTEVLLCRPYIHFFHEALFHKERHLRSA